MERRGTGAARIGRAPDVVALLLIALAAGLRFGLRWGLPNNLHSYSYHPDEFLIVGSALQVLRAGLPSFYNYPSLFIYLCAIAIGSATGYGIAANPGDIYLSARVVTALMGTAAVWVTYWAGKTLFSGWAGVIAALILCITPLHVQHSHFATVDVPSTLFVAAALGCAGLVLKRGTMRDYVLAGAMVGLAAGTKYNAGLVVLAPLAAHFLGETRSLRDRRLWAMIGCAIAAFVISTPGVLLQPGQFAHGIAYELRHSAEGHGLVFAGTGNGLIYTFRSSLWYGLGALLAMLLGGSVIYALWKRDRAALVILAFVLPYYILVSVSQVRFARYVLPILPAAALLCGWAMHSALKSMPVRPIERIGRGLLIVFSAAAVLSSLFYTFTLDLLFALPDPRDDAARWVARHVQRGSTIGVPDVPWFYSPPLSPDIGFGALPQRREAMEKAPYDIVVFSDCGKPGCWADDPPQWVIMTDYETADAERLAEDRSLSPAVREQVDRIVGDLRLVDRLYTRRADFRGFWQVFDLGALPHDMRYPDPSITIYERRR